ncbi:MAG: hypothetical protein ACXVB9_12305 [Bdellovibrionota bacterium]
MENGGNSIMCLPENAQPHKYGSPIPEQPIIEGYDGEFDALDYVRALTSGYRPEDFVQLRSWREGQERLARILQEVSPALSRTFLEFAESTKQIQLPIQPKSARRFWTPKEGSPYGFRLGPTPWTLPDRCYLPHNAHFSGTEGDARISFIGRTVTRRQTERHIEYIYNPLGLANLAGKSYLQFSILMTHEWLWDHTADIDVNQAVSVFLHSRELERMTGPEISDRLHTLGLKF